MPIHRLDSRNLIQMKGVFVGNLCVIPSILQFPSRVYKRQDGVSPSPNPESWLEVLIDGWLTLVSKWCVGSVPTQKLQRRTRTVIESFDGKQWFV